MLLCEGISSTNFSQGNWEANDSGSQSQAVQLHSPKKWGENRKYYVSSCHNPKRALRAGYFWALLTFLVMISGFMISKRWSLLLFSSAVRADPIPVGSANPSSYRDVHPGLLLIMCYLLPKANCASMPYNLQPDRKLTFPFSQPFTLSSSFPKCIQQNFKTLTRFPPFPVFSVIDVFFQCSGLGQFMD